MRQPKKVDRCQNCGADEKLYYVYLPAYDRWRGRMLCAKCRKEVWDVQTPVGDILPPETVKDDIKTE